VSPAKNSKPPSGGTITNDRCLTHIRDATHSESILPGICDVNNLAGNLFLKRPAHIPPTYTYKYTHSATSWHNTSTTTHHSSLSLTHSLPHTLYIYICIIGLAVATSDKKRGKRDKFQPYLKLLGYSPTQDREKEKKSKKSTMKSLSMMWICGILII